MSTSLSQPPPSIQDGQAMQQHSIECQLLQPQSSDSSSSQFPIRITPPGYPKHPGPRSPVEAFKESRRWMMWNPDKDYDSRPGFWRSSWVKKPTHDDARDLVDEMVLCNVLPKCFLMTRTDDGGDQGAAAQILFFSRGSYNQLFTLHCRCHQPKQQEHAAEPQSRTNSDVELIEPRSPSPPGLSSSSPQNTPEQPPNSSSSNESFFSCKSSLLCHGSGIINDEENADHSHIPTEVLLRLAKPLDPYFKTESEVATVHFARVRGIPVPRIYAYDSSAANCLGLEWQLVQKISGTACDLEEAAEEACDALIARGVVPDSALQELDKSEAWVRLGRQVAGSLNLLRSGARPDGQGHSQAAGFDGIGSLYWDFEKHDFVLGPVCDKIFIKGRRLLYHGDNGGDPDFPISRGPFRTAGEYLNAQLAILLRESKDESLSLADNTATDMSYATTGTDPDSVPIDTYTRLRNWYTKADSEMIHDQVSKLRHIILPWLVTQLTPGQQERMQTFISHPDLHVSNVLVSRRLKAQLDHNIINGNNNSNSDGQGEEEFELTAILDWENTKSLPDYLIMPVPVEECFRWPKPTLRRPAIRHSDWREMLQLLGKAGDGGSGAQSPWIDNGSFTSLPVPDSFAPWRRGDEPGVEADDAQTARGSGNGSKVNGDGDAAHEVLSQPRQLINAEVLLHFIDFQLKVFIGEDSCQWINQLAKSIQAHIAVEGKK